jgi:Zn ribbon nucleic-acid-binding protein
MPLHSGPHSEIYVPPSSKCSWSSCGASGENRTLDTQSRDAGASPAGGTNHNGGETMDTQCPRCLATYSLHKGQDNWGHFTECRICGWHLDHLQPEIPITRESEREEKNDEQDQV